MGDPKHIAAARSFAHQAVDELIDKIRDAELYFGRGSLELTFQHARLTHTRSGIDWMKFASGGDRVSSHLKKAV